MAQINSLVKRFEDAQRMMKAMAGGGGMPGMGGLPAMGPGGLPGGKKSKGKQAPQRKVKGKSGNPAKRAAQERALREGKPASTSGSAFGMGQHKPEEPAFDPSQLPSLDKYLRG